MIKTYLPKLKQYFDLISHGNITLDDSKNHIFYESVGPRYLVRSDVDINSLKDLNDQNINYLMKT